MVYEAHQPAQLNGNFRLCGCKENGYDNVRVVRGYMTVRCRVCEERVKASTVDVKGWRCYEFWMRGTCPRGDECPRIHLHIRKRNLQQRIDVHGEEKLAPILTQLAKQTAEPRTPPALKSMPKPEVPEVSHPHSFQQALMLPIDFDSSHSSSLSASGLSASGRVSPSTPSPRYQEFYRFDPYSMDTSLVPVWQQQ
eukprot:TRINITY_DN13792_c0_g1_i1.p1 TRINITY_DN13792_c0_g1~~TRINITY_DN13792_c0_g1_i1.p1  ORF type:complete len:195 (+),score=58.21 TRINITY_DN13792_c0_g1_i1:54-638(+)